MLSAFLMNLSILLPVAKATSVTLPASDSEVRNSYPGMGYTLAVVQVWPDHLRVELPNTAVGTAWTLLGLFWNYVADLYLFQKHLVCCEYIHSMSLRMFLKRMENAKWCARN